MKGFTVEDLITLLEKVENKKASIMVNIQVDSMAMSGTVYGLEESKSGVALKVKDSSLKSI